ncbi:unnamed protein product [Amoebophrya sp. A120]|nr:unnamed protein product [Amoebophrya sp. A120]|eukprot:GSA120T00020096001.1
MRRLVFVGLAHNGVQVARSSNDHNHAASSTSSSSSSGSSRMLRREPKVVAQEGTSTQDKGTNALEAHSSTRTQSDSPSFLEQANDDKTTRISSSSSSSNRHSPTTDKNNQVNQDQQPAFLNEEGGVEVGRIPEQAPAGGSNFGAASELELAEGEAVGEGERRGCSRL